MTLEDGCLQGSYGVVDEGLGESAAVLHGPVDGALADPGSGSDVVHRHGGDPSLGDEAARRIEHPHPVPFCVDAPRTPTL